jgi:hypothetical protein
MSKSSRLQWQLLTLFQWRVQLRGVGGDPCVVIGDGGGNGAHEGTDLYGLLTPIE